MNRNYDGMDHDEDDRDASYYDYLWCGPEDEEQEVVNIDDEQDGKFEHELDDLVFALDHIDCNPNSPPLPAAALGDEASSRLHFRLLKRKYQIEFLRSPSPLDPLYAILVKVDLREKLDCDELRTISKYHREGSFQCVYIRLASDSENRFMDSLDYWEAVNASKYWRTAKKPDKAIAFTEGLDEKIDASGYKVKAALLTTRAGAFRDQKVFDMAISLGLQATKLFQTFHPYMLLGATCYQTGNPKSGDEYFSIAIRLGAKPAFKDYEIVKAVGEATEAEQRLSAEYLLQKDPIKYKWAAKYLH